MMDTLVKTLLCINFLCIIWYFLRDTVKENAKNYEFKHTFGIEKTFWALIPNVNLNFSQGFTFEIEFLCFHYYFDLTKKKDFSELYQKIFDSIFSSVKVPEHLKLKPDFGRISADDFIDNCKKFSRMDVRDSKNDGWDKFWINEISVGNWIRIQPTHDLKNQHHAVVFNNGEDVTFGFDHFGQFTDSYSIKGIRLKRVSPATSELVKNILLNEASNRGYGIGTLFKSLANNDLCIVTTPYFSHFYPNEIQNTGYGTIFKNGKWAKILTKNEGKTD